MLNRRAAILLLVAALITVVGVVMARSPDSLLSKAELTAGDLVARHGRRTPMNPKLIFLAIDNDAISLDARADLQGLFGIKDATTPEGRALTLISERWPWPRSVYALVLDRLLGAGAAVVTFDLNFPTPSDDDAEFRAALERYKGKVVIGSNFTTSQGDENGRVDASLTLPTEVLIPQGGRDERIGYVNFWPDADGVIRRAQFNANFAQFLGPGANLGEPDYASLAAQTIRAFGRADAVPADRDSHLFRYTAGPQEAFPSRSIYEIFVPEYWKRNFDGGKVFDGAIVVVGSAGNWQHDDHDTPFGRMAGAEIQLNAMNALLHREFLRPLSGPAWLAIYLMAGALSAYIAAYCSSPLQRLLLLMAIGGAWFALQFALYNRFGQFAPLFGPLAILTATWIFGLVYDLVSAGAEQLRLHLTLEERARAQAMLEAANAELEHRVSERTADLTEANARLTSSLEEKNVLLKEVHHRVKNNLQVISSLLNLQSGYIKDPVALQVFTESRSRVRSMALIHEKLYQSQDLTRIDFEDYIKAVSIGLKSTFAGRSSAIRISVDVERIMLPVDSAVPCGLIVNELVTNCFKYAFRENGTGEIKISMKRLNDANLQLSVSDDGVGFPHDVDFRNTESLGMQLVTTLSEQLDGIVTMRNGCGTTFEISFPENNPTRI